MNNTPPPFLHLYLEKHNIVVNNNPSLSASASICSHSSNPSSYSTRHWGADDNWQRGWISTAFHKLERLESVVSHACPDLNETCVDHIHTLGSYVTESVKLVLKSVLSKRGKISYYGQYRPPEVLQVLDFKKFWLFLFQTRAFPITNLIDVGSLLVSCEVPNFPYAIRPSFYHTSCSPPSPSLYTNSSHSLTGAEIFTQHCRRQPTSAPVPRIIASVGSNPA